MKTKMQILVFVLLVCSLEATSSIIASTTNSNHTIVEPGVIAKPGCQSHCGNLKVPYPFGIKKEGLNCSIDPSFDITCNTSTHPPKAFLQTGHFQVYNISDTELRVSNLLASMCYTPSGDPSVGYSASGVPFKRVHYQTSTYTYVSATSIDSNALKHLTAVEGYSFSTTSINTAIEDYSSSTSLSGTPYRYSDLNVFTAVGCNEYAYIYDAENDTLPKGCIATCHNAREVPKDECLGIGCCQVSVKVVKYFDVKLDTYDSDTNVSSFNPCGYAFFGEKSSFKFRGASDLNDSTFVNRTQSTVPLVLDWVIDENSTCAKAARDSISFACRYANSTCIDAAKKSGGYHCSCRKGYQGNPYLEPGCQDIDECENPNKHDCQHNCINTPGSYSYSCPHGHYGDGKRTGNGCIARKHNRLVFTIELASLSSLGAMILLFAAWQLYKVMQIRNERKLRKKLFEKNGGLLLQQQLSSPEGNVETNKLFNSKELEKATDGYNEDRILGQGGQGTVYKGMMTDGRIVAVKKSRIEDETKLVNFINEVVILSQTNHRNIVKLHGCCLETEVPLSVYEFIPNGTLFEYIHDLNEDFPLSWDVRVRVAAEVAGALFYLHSAASIPIYHRDIKSTNILLDHKYSAKVADFGTSKSICIDQTHMTTLVQGTLGYMDPEFIQSSQYTDKSDVYSFGVVLVELLTGRKPIFRSLNYQRSTLAAFFMLAMQEDRLFDILDAQVMEEGAIEEILMFANIAKRCLNLNGRERPTMKQVAIEVERIRMSEGAPGLEQLCDEIHDAPAELNGPPDITLTSSNSASTINSLSIDCDVAPI